MLLTRTLPTAVATLTLACGSSNGNPASGDRPYRVGAADRGAVRVTIEETGLVEPERQIVVKSPISGVARRLLVREGDSVVTGQLMATIVPDIAQANQLARLQSEISAAEIAVANLRRGYMRAQELSQRSLMPDAEVDAVRTELEQAENRHAAAREQLRLMEASGVEAEGESQSARITAPASGVADLSTLLIQAAVNEVDIGKVARGDTVAITVDAFPGDTARGVVRLVPPAARQQERVRVFDVEIEVRGGQGILRPGMTANVRIAGPSRDDVVRVPVEAVFLPEGQPIVFRLVDGEPQATPITLGLSDLVYVEIVDGLAPGDSVALEDPVEAERRARLRGR
jgi:RND family efflux transporter MFP subunit